MTEISAPRSALSALSINTAHNAQVTHNTRLSLSHKQHQKPTTLDTTTSTTASKRSSLTKRQSLSASRQSLLPAASATSSAASRHSLSRASLSHQPSRPSSLTHGGSTRADPRPVHDKAYVRSEAQKIIAYCALRQYPQPLSVKLLASPSSRDFKTLILWLIQRVDPAFEWTDGGKEVEDDIKRVMRLFGYPFNVSKNAIIAAGTPHTWPSLLVMLAWLVDFLLYDEAVNGWYDAPNNGATGDGSAAEAGGDGGEGEFDTERCYFRYMCESYSAMMAEDADATARVDADLAAAFHRRTQRVQHELAAMEARRQQLTAEHDAHVAMQRQVGELRARRANFAADKERFLVYKGEMEAHLAHQHEKGAARQAEVDERQRREAELRREAGELGEAIACQEFTPLQLQSMLHQQQLLADTLADVAAQQTRATAEVYELERSVSERLSSLQALVSEYNQLAVSVELVPATAKHAAGGDYSLRVVDEAGGWVQPAPATTVQPQLAALHRQLTTAAATLTASVRGLHDDWARLGEAKADKARQLAASQQQCARREDAYRRDKDEMNAALRALIEQLEGEEARVVALQGGAERSERERAERALGEAEAERARVSAEWREVRVREQREMWGVIEELVAHVERIHGVLGGLRGLANTVKAAVDKPLEL